MLQAKPLPCLRRARFLAAVGALLPLAPLLGGCQMLGAVAYFLGPKRVQKAEFSLAKGRVALVIEYRSAQEASPIFDRQLYERVVQIFRDEKSETTFVPLERWAQLRQENPQTKSWSIQRIGRALEAEQVLYLQVDRLSLRESPEHPVLAPRVALQARVISASEPPPHHRLWPTGPTEDGRAIEAQRPPQEMPSVDVIDRELGKLARETAYLLTRYFLDTDLEERTPKER